MKKKVEVSQTVGTEDQLLQILNFAGLSELEKLKRIGPAKAKKILKGREDGLYTTVSVNICFSNQIYDLERVGISKKPIDTIRSDNIHSYLV